MNKITRIHLRDFFAILIVAEIVFYLNGFASSSKPDISSYEYFSKTSELFKQNKEAAIKQYRIFIKEYPKDDLVPEAEFMIGECLYELDPTSNEALKIFEKVSNKYSNNQCAQAAVFRIAEIYYNLKKYENSLEWLKKAESKYPKSYLIYEIKLLKAHCLLTQNRFIQAEKILTEILDKNNAYKDDKRFNYIYGLINYQLEKNEIALENFEKVDSEESLLFSSKVLLRLKKPLFSVEKLKEFINEYPESSNQERAHFLIAEAFFAADDYLSAIQSYEKYIQLFPRSKLKGLSMFKMGCAYLELKDNLQARSNFQSYLQYEPNSEFTPLSIYLIGESFLRDERYKEASFAYGDIQNSYQDNFYAPNSQFRLGWCYYKLKDFQKAKNSLIIFKQQYENHKLYPQVEILLGNIFYEVQDYAQAASCYQRAIDRTQEVELRESALALMSRANYLNENYTALVSGYHYLLNTFPPSKSLWRLITYLYIAEGYLKQGLYKEAIELYNLVETVYPTNNLLIYAKDGYAWAKFLNNEFSQAQDVRENIQNQARQREIPDSLNVANVYELANSMFNQKKYLKALDLYNEFIYKNPGHYLIPPASFRSGYCYYKLEYFSQAIDTWENLANQYPNEPEAAESLWMVADTYFRAQFYDKSINTYKKLLDKYVKDEQESAKAYLRIAQCYFNSKQNEKAIESLRNLIEKFPNEHQSYEALDFLIAILETSSEKEKVLDALNDNISKLGETAPIVVELRFRIARNHFENKDYNRAIIVFKTLMSELIESDKFADSNYYLGVSYYKIAEFEQASVTLKRFMENFPEDKRAVYALFLLGSSYFKSKQYELAAESFEKRIMVKKDSEYLSTALYNSAVAYREIKEWDKAVNNLKKYKEKFAKQDELLSVNMQLASIYEEQRQYEQAVQILKETRNNINVNTQAWGEITFRIAEDLISAGKNDDGITVYKELVQAKDKQMDSWGLSAMVRLAEHYEKSSDNEQAFSMYEKILEKSKLMKNKPDWIDAIKSRIEILRNSGNGNSK